MSVAPQTIYNNKGGKYMAIVAVRRGDIFMADLPQSNKNTIFGKHPCLIISNHISNKTSQIVTVLPLTSTCGDNPSTVLVGFKEGLDHNSNILTNMITSIDKTRLLRKMCFLDTQMMDKVGKILNAQLGVTNRGNCVMLKNLENEKMRVRLAKYQEDYTKFEELAEEYYNNICLLQGEDQLDKIEISGELEWSLYNLALAKYKNNKTEESYILVKEALTHEAKSKADHSYTCWLLGSICTLKGESFIAEGVKAFEDCEKFYREIGEEKYLILTLFNKAKISKNISEMKDCIETYKLTRFKPMVISFGDMDSVLSEMEEELANIL